MVNLRDRAAIAFVPEGTCFDFNTPEYYFHRKKGLISELQLRTSQTISMRRSHLSADLHYGSLVMKIERLSLVLTVAAVFFGASIDHSSGFESQDPAKSPEPPKTWKEHWFEHEQVVKLVASNEDVAIYFDDDMPKETLDWIEPFLTKAWQYTKTTYGSFGPDGRLYAVFHKGKYGGGHPSTYFDRTHDNRNVIDCGANSWDASMLDMPSHEIGHIVEGANHDVHESPGFDVWKDSKWIELYQYDLYTALKLDKHAQRVSRKFSQQSDNFPKRNAHWFRDFFHPLWRDHGREQLMAKFFRLTAERFPKEPERDGVRQRYTRRMNWGEFLHFMCGAAGKDVRTQAKKAFGWKDEWEEQFKQAQVDFPDVMYKK